MALDDQVELDMLEQIPDGVVDTLFCSYLFNSFTQKFSNFFMIEKMKSSSLSVFDLTHAQHKSFYTWKDTEYRDFMIGVLQNLEPIHYQKNTVLINELDEFSEITFVNKGIVMIGYELNKEKRYCIQFNDRCVIGAYGITFNKRASFLYACKTDIEGFFIRKMKWIETIEEAPLIEKIFKKNVLVDYLLNIRGKVMVYKNKIIKEHLNR